ncbi:hypothetical protein GGR58DRAFT_174864 [Xylaria digitata]|nr:hypothetical protein GGR58DRAFT_174864 [Xylaria digitata]
MPSNYGDNLEFLRSDISLLPNCANPLIQPHEFDDIKIVTNASAYITADSSPDDSLPSKAISKPAKRQRDDSERNQDGKVGEHASSQSSSSKKPRLADDSGGFACPFYKKDPWRFYQCLNYKLSKICYVKQHLSRYHDDASEYCPICHHQFNDETERGSHILAKNCQPNQTTIHVMTANQKKDIQLATGRKISVEDKWYQIWSILFPWAKRPDSPYVKGHAFAEALSSIRAFCHGPGSHIVTETPPSALLLDGNIDTECADSSNVSTSPNSHSTVSRTSLLDSPSTRSLENYSLVIPHISSISYDEQEAFSGTLETPCDTVTAAEYYEYGNDGAGEPFDAENTEFCPVPKQ